MIGLAESVESDTSETVWPTTGADGTQLNAAVGPGGVGATATVKVAGALAPAFPAASRCEACTVYVPGASPPKVPDQVPSLDTWTPSVSSGVCGPAAAAAV